MQELEKPGVQILLEAKKYHKEDNLTYNAQEQD
jgi:hypothetical protein